MVGFSGAANPNALLDRVDALERSVPGLAPAAATLDEAGPATRPSVEAAVAATATAAAQETFRPNSAGIVQLLSEMFTLSARMRELSGLAAEAESLKTASDKFRQPLREELTDLLRRADALTNAPVAPPDDPAALTARSRQLDAMTSRFRVVSAAAMPLGEQGSLLDTTRGNLQEWRTALGRVYTAALRNLLFRTGGMAVLILATLGLSVVWRRATFRYVHEARRRRQFMLLRRIVVSILIAIILTIGFVTEFGSLATFAGILTAGIAVSLQTLILSGVAYFFFIGRYGVRTGDRVTVGGVTGEVIETGLFRLYMTELGGGGSGGAGGARPTGRIVVFSNSVLFQPAGFFKQVPGTDFGWHEVALTLAPDSNLAVAESRLMGAVNGVFAGYKESIERQHAAARRTGVLGATPPHPEGRLRFVDTGLEFAVRYPVELSRAPETDDAITRALLAAIDQEPRLKLVATATPKIQPA
jgi:small-conductance mechanosensitive channel